MELFKDVVLFCFVFVFTKVLAPPTGQDERPESVVKWVLFGTVFSRFGIRVVSVSLHMFWVPCFFFYQVFFPIASALKSHPLYLCQ